MASARVIHAVDCAPGIVALPEWIDAWMEVAKPGDRFLYATRCGLPIGNPGAGRMRELADRGLVDLTQQRSTLDRSVHNYFARRTEKPTALAKPDRPKLVAPSAPLADGEATIIDALLPVLERFANHGRPCPTDKQLAARARLTEDAVKAGLVAMTAAHLIGVQKVAAPTLRRIVIIASGARTGLAS